MSVEHATIQKIQVGKQQFNTILRDEEQWINTRRGKVEEKEKKTGNESGYKKKEVNHDTVGLALSGGGIRSATFNLGILQALERYGILKHVDYLSTVSGGGYIGSCFTWFMHMKEKFPFGTTRSDHDKMGGQVLAWLRSHGKYLTSGDGLNIWTLISALLTGILINLLVVVPVLLFLFFGLTWKTGFVTFMPPFLQSYVNQYQDRLLIYFFLAGLGMLLLWLGLVIITTILPGFFNKLRQSGPQRIIRVFTGDVLQLGIMLTLVGTIPIVYQFIHSHTKGWLVTAMMGISLFGALAMLGGSRNRNKNNEIKGHRSFLLTAGLALLIYGIFMLFFHLGISKLNGLYLLIGSGISLVLALLANINHVSMHRYYRNCLMQAYLPDKIHAYNEDQNGNVTVTHDDVGNPDECLFKNIRDTATPFHIVNTNVVTIGSRDYYLSGRGGDNFIFSPLYCGSDATGFIPTAKYAGGKMNLPTAMSISGAAVNPNSYATRSRPLSMIMTLLNVRLGYWIRNPKRMPKHKYFLRPMWYYYMFAEMFGSGLSERHKQIHLSDGGHFENLGLYELLRRHCRYIIVSDAGADKDWDYGDLSRLVQMVRLDFGAEVVVNDLEKLTPAENGFSQTPFVFGTVEYSNGDTSELIYIKTTLIEDLPEDLLTYHRENPDFPDQSTMDQFFNEKQFEAYRELGYLIGKRLGKRFNEKKPTSLFSAVKR